MSETAMRESEVSNLLNKIKDLKEAIHKVIIGQEEVIDQLLVGLIAGGHVLLEGVPGLAKTLMVKSLAEAINSNFKRIQFTPDLMPADILGTEILQSDEEGNKFFRFTKGPVFSNIVLADEINRTPPKTQAALLELMQEYSVTYAGKVYDLPKPFFLLATQNPIEQSGTFPLPEAQVDRFLLFIRVGYPSEQEEEQILLSTTGKAQAKINQVFQKEEIIALQALSREVHIDLQLVREINKTIRLTRPATSENSKIKEYVEWGVGPRAGQAWILASKAYALLNGRYSVIPTDIKAMMLPALQHRILLNFKAQSENIQIKDLLQELYNSNV